MVELIQKLVQTGNSKAFIIPSFVIKKYNLEVQKVYKIIIQELE
jgi:antitoxin component of MazEF toxin-antitoxin module